MMQTLVVIVNYRTAELVIDCLRSIEPQVGSAGDLRVTVTDNCSGDDSVPTLRRAIDEHGWSDWVELMPLERNDGFAAGNNAAIRAALAQPDPPAAIVLLNSDTLVRPGALAEMTEATRADPTIGLVGPRLEWPDGEAQISCFRDITPITQLLNAAETGPISKLLPRHEVAIPVSDQPVRPAWLSFACVLIRREVFEQIGLLDDDFFMYYEDVDYCRRARAAGWRIVYQPRARVVHLRGGSGPTKALAQAREPRPAYYYAARGHYFSKHYGRLGLWTANGLWTLGRSVSWLRETVGRKTPHTCRRELRDIWTRPRSARP